MRRFFFWAAVVGTAAVAGLVIVRGVSQLAQTNPKEDRTAAGAAAAAPLRMVRLYFGGSERVGLVTEERAILDPGGPEKLAEAIANEVFRGPQTGRGITGFSPATRVRAFYLAPDGTGYLDLSQDFLDRWPQGDGLEWVSLGSLVRSLADNVPGVRCVHILIEGRTVVRSPGSIPLDLPLDPAGFVSGSEVGNEGEPEMETDL